ncbi:MULTISPECIES: DUF3137 domain-containing protein [unclassified Campylobacter]|uniref:DUF3137 domain-containing protein n=1 Tax=unclassified Campylobacter TaxID=2593542 RepID=UPI0022E9C128|nr:MULTISPECIES: DUF3137 domain-containing protein [unclassified Campylobacter]MDA3045223.1 DUF3137 domain-containing protein [Campylobacter sp. JMF_07 ED4]MDA3064177.1 DUF3137 domain-containing protein [Campylobacter sp. JMF_11 EL3]MDA3071951.1 DUF3137 domain-containing protein [Campylobacter sp. VBCF_03 NA9]MDA3075365.1 DUF3137 domain-containing protein [Campylobacter sp. JMF_05 ED3]
MDIYELENLRKNTLKEIDNLKPFVILGTFIIPLLVFLLHLSFNDVERWAFFSCYIMLFFILLSFFNIINLMKQKYDKVLLISYVLPIVLGIFIANFVNNAPHFFVITLMIFSMFYFYTSIMHNIRINKSKIYRRSFKMKYLYHYLKNIGCKYIPEGGINLTAIKSSNLFEAITLINENDKIIGQFDSVKFEMCDVVLRDDSKNNNANELWGIFFYAEFNKQTNSELFVVSKNTEALNIKKFKKITMDDTKFNATFSVYCDDMQNAMYILSPAFMKRLLDLKRRLNFPISVSFAGDKIYIFLDTGKDNFEPDIDKSVLHANPAFTIKRELSHFLSIVKTLNLNTRIWKV